MVGLIDLLGWFVGLSIFGVKTWLVLVWIGLCLIAYDVVFGRRKRFSAVAVDDLGVRDDGFVYYLLRADGVYVECTKVEFDSVDFREKWYVWAKGSPEPFAGVGI